MSSAMTTIECPARATCSSSRATRSRGRTAGPSRLFTGRESLVRTSTATFTPRSEAALEIDSAGAGHDITDAVGDDGLCEDGRRARAIPDGITGALGRLPDHLRTEVLVRILQVHLLGNGHAVVADDRRSEPALDQHALGLGPSVTRTASASVFTPVRTFSRARDRNSTRGILGSTHRASPQPSRAAFESMRLATPPRRTGWGGDAPGEASALGKPCARWFRTRRFATEPGVAASVQPLANVSGRLTSTPVERKGG